MRELNEDLKYNWLVEIEGICRKYLSYTPKYIDELFHKKEEITRIFIDLDNKLIFYRGRENDTM